MPYVRVSVLKPRTDHRMDVQNMVESLLKRFKSLPGFIDGYLMLSTDGTGRIGRVTVWKSRRDADKAAMEQDVLVTRSLMNQMIEEEEEVRLEQGFESIRA